MNNNLAFSLGGSIVHGPSSVPLLHGIGASRHLAGKYSKESLQILRLKYHDVT